MTQALGGIDLSAFVRKNLTGETEQVELLVRGAHCAGCMTKIEQAALEEPGVIGARFNLTTGKLAVMASPGTADPARLIQAITDLGFQVSPYEISAARGAEDEAGRKLLLALAVAGFGTANVMMFTVPVWAGFFGQEMTPATRETLLWLSALVAAPCAVFAGMPFFKSAWRSLRHGKANMDVPISIGVILTLAVSFSETARGGAHAYFDAAVTLLFLLLIGRYLDHRLRATARSAASDLLALQAAVAIRISADGRRRGVPVGQVSPGDLLAIAPGDRIPVDGKIEAGSSVLDNSLITGESRPVPVGAGQKVYAGALNQSGELILRATAPSDSSAISAIARLMEAGAQHRSAYVRLADKAAALYVPIVHTAALATFLGGWALGLGPREALLRAAAVLIVTCPCALGLAVPAVQIAASGRLFRKGVLVKSGAALERLAEVDHIVFDKTGVLTTGEPVLFEADPHLVALAASLARASRHPLAQALARAAGPGDVAQDVVEVAGHGVEGLVSGRRAKLGRASYVGARSSEQETELWFGFEGGDPRRLAFHDKIRPEAARVIADLRARGYEISILSGDVPGAVEIVASTLGVDQWSAGLTPASKARAVDGATLSGRKVLMVGDGLNDAAALAKAHASMAPGAAIDASQNAADLVYSSGDLSAVPLALEVARQARRRALENFTFAGVYNFVAIPAAMFGLINPFVAALAMSGSSLAVTLNALRMTWAGRRA
jgi:Cu2+-exporting ATPase